MITDNMKKVAMLRAMVGAGTVSLNIVEVIVTKAESGGDLSANDINLLMRVSGQIGLRWPEFFGRPPKEMTNIIDLARWWLDFLKNQLEEQKIVLSTAESRLTERERKMMEIGVIFTLGSDRFEPDRRYRGGGSFEPW